MSPDVSRDLCISVPDSAFTVSGFRSWTESGDFPTVGRVDLCDAQVLVDMSPERTESHTLVKTEISRVLGSLVRDSDLGEFLVDGVRFTSESAEISTEPDGLFFSFESWEAGRVRGGQENDSPLGVVGEVDWVLEVVSPSSIEKDRQRLFRGYALAGVREYWIVDALGESVEFDVYVLGTDGYRPQPSDDGWRGSVVFGKEFKLELGRAHGRRKYTLAVR